MSGMILRVEGGPDAGRTLAIPAQGGVIGRQAGVEIALADPLLSRRHARIEVRDGRLLLSDLGSANGTRVNGQPVSGERELRPGDLVEVGDTRLRLAEGASSADATIIPSAAVLPPAVAEGQTLLRSVHDDATVPLAESPEQLPRTVSEVGSVLNGRYRLDRQIGRGGFARVYLATDLTLGRPVAIKVLDPELVEQGEERDFLARFAAEARSVALLDHPNILSVFDYGQTGNTAFLVMPYVEGGTLHDRLRLGTGGGRVQPLDPAVAASYLRQAAAALDYAHRRSLVHRDIKPQNMLLRNEDDRLLLADFGIAKVLSSTGAQSRTGIMGTLSYMAPEQFRGEVGRAVDIYALGCVAFQLLTGQLPYSGPTERVMYAHLQEPVPQLAARGGGHLPAALQGVLDKALAKNPIDRYASAGELARAFDAALAAPDVTSPLPRPLLGADAAATQIANIPARPEPPRMVPPVAPPPGASDSTVIATNQVSDPSAATQMASSAFTPPPASYEQPTQFAGSPPPPILPISSMPTPSPYPVPSGGKIGRRALIGGAAGAGVVVLGLGGLLAVRAAGNGSPTATAAPASGGTAIPAASSSAAPGAAQAAAAPASAAPASTATASSSAPSAAASSAASVATSAPPSAAPTALPSSASAASGPRPTKRGGGGQLKLLWWQAPVTLNPHLAQGQKDTDAARPVYEPLAVIGGDGSYIPVLAAEIPSRANGGLSADGTVVTWKLKPGVKWSDSQPFTAKDVAFTYNYVIDPATAATTTASYKVIKSVEAVDDTTVRITFASPQAAWFIPFTNQNGCILPEHIFKDGKGGAAANFAANLKPVGTGPYRVVSFKPGDSANYDINPNFRDANAPFFDTVQLVGGGDAPTAARAVLQTGDVDYAWNLQVDAALLTQLESGGQGTVMANPGASTERLLINFTDPNKDVAGERSSLKSPHPFQAEKAVRNAYALACDKKTIVEAIYGKAGAIGNNLLYNPPQYNSPNTKSEYDLAKANALLDQAGWAKAGTYRAKGGVPMKITYSTTVNAVRQKTQQVVKDGLEKIGVQVELKSADAGVFFAPGSGGNPDSAALFYNDIEMYTNGNVSPDPFAYMEGLTTVQIAQKANQWSGANYMRWSNKDYDAAIEALKTELDEKKRADLYIKANDIEVNDFAEIPLVARNNVSGRAKSLVIGIYTPWDSELWNIALWLRQ